MEPEMERVKVGEGWRRRGLEPELSMGGGQK